MIGGFHDGVNMLSKLTPRRAWNAVQVFSSYHRSKGSKSAQIGGLPLSISIEPTTSCNLRCPECPSGLRSFTRPRGMLDKRLFSKVIDELAPSLSYLTFYFQGEPFLHPEFPGMAAYASARGIYTATSTNGHYLHDENARRTVESGLDRLIVSIDGITQPVYQAYRQGGSLEAALEGIRNIVSWKRKLRSRTPHVVLQFLVVGPNEHQVPGAFKLAKQLRVDQVVLKTAQINDYQHGSPLMPRQEHFSRYRRLNDGTYALKNSLDNHCWKMWQGCVVTWDGKVVPCCFDKDAHHVLGDLNTSSFAEVWHGQTYQEFRKLLLTSRSKIDICSNCTEGTKVFA